MKIPQAERHCKRKAYFKVFNNRNAIRGDYLGRKARKTYETESDVFAARLRSVMEVAGMTRSALAKEISVKPQTVSLYTTGQSQPTADGISKIAHTLGVSADYLLGLSDVKANNPALTASCQYTGLSEDACSLLHDMSTSENDSAHEVLDFITRLICVLPLNRIGDDLGIIAKAHTHRHEDAGTIEISSDGMVTLPPLESTKYLVEKLSECVAVNTEVVCWDRLEGR